MPSPVVRISVQTPIELARTADFDVGAMRVRPVALEVDYAGQTQRLEPRVMQALVALCEANGEVVSRDDLIARCWSGLVVGDDAINRVMSKIRRLSKGDGGGAFKLETVPRVGYRLEIESAQDSPAPALPRWADLAQRRWRLISIVAATAAAISLWLATQTPSYEL